MNVWQRYPRTWRWFNIVLASTVVFWLSDWDLQIAQLFRLADHWLLDDFPLWKAVFYDGVTLIVIVVFFGGLLTMLIGSLQRHYQLRLSALYVLLVFLVGPGLLVNTVFKDQWGRPRPIQVAELGGQERYVPPGYFVANGEGRSFPSGHSSIGFAFVAFWFLWRQRKPQWARLALAFSVTLGAMIGLTRMAAGGHFLSDVMWSAWVVLFAAWLLYYPLMRMAEREYRHMK